MSADSELKSFIKMFLCSSRTHRSSLTTSSCSLLIASSCVIHERSHFHSEEAVDAQPASIDDFWHCRRHFYVDDAHHHRRGAAETLADPGRLWPMGRADIRRTFFGWALACLRYQSDERSA